MQNGRKMMKKIHTKTEKNGNSMQNGSRIKEKCEPALVVVLKSLAILMSLAIITVFSGCSSTQGEVETLNPSGETAGTGDNEGAGKEGSEGQDGAGTGKEGSEGQDGAGTGADIEGPEAGADNGTADNDGTGAEGSKGQDGAGTGNKANDGAAADYWTGPDENQWDGGPDFASIATQFNGIFKDMTIEEAAEKYAITLVEGGKYRDYEGDIGDIIPQYKDIDLDGDRKTDVIRREGAHYVIECSSAGTFETDDYSSSPNEGEIIEFEDTGCRNIDEIMIAHYTFGTGGPVAWDTAIYTYQKGKWKACPIIDKESVINSKELRDYIGERTGKKYEPGSVTVSAVDMSILLLNFGQKNGPEQINDYEAVSLFRNFMPDCFNERDDFSYYGGSALYLLLNNWPLEISGEPVKLTGELQKELNTFMSNFSEQNYRQGAYEATMAHFGLQWSKINKSLKPVQKDGKTYYRINHSDLNGILSRYFLTNLEEGEFDDCDIDNDYGGYMEYVDGEGGYYCEPAADGDMYANNAFTVVSSVEGLGYERPWTYMRLGFKVYRLNADDYNKHGIGKEQYSLSADEAAKLAGKGKLVPAYDGTAIVIKTDDGYALTDYGVSEL